MYLPFNDAYNPLNIFLVAQLRVNTSQDQFFGYSHTGGGSSGGTYKDIDCGKTYEAYT